MLVYGDHRETCDPRERLILVQEQLEEIASAAPGLERHAKLVGALIATGQIVQGIEDRGVERPGINAALLQLACCVITSWESGFVEIGRLPKLRLADLPDQVELRLPEGFAFYAVYPEAYIEAARRLELSGPPCVIGLRSIGTTLAAVVAAALGAPAPINVRPFGDPFRRQVSLPDAIVDERSHYVIVDEGPGLSGSSFGSVADWLEDRGVPIGRIAFLPSHAGPLGPHAIERHRDRWARAQRRVAEFEPGFLEERFGLLTSFATGRPGERSKFLGFDNGKPVLLKFAGLGSIGAAKLRLAQTLQAAGVTPEPIALVHGYLVERWCEGARPLGAEERPVAEIGRYIGARARLLSGEGGSGASVAELMRMCRRNIALALGEDAARSVDRFDAQSLARQMRPQRTDNKLDRCEWIRLASGRLLKCDALDHHQSHDLIGCQDPAWDVAGAAVEFDLDAEETGRLSAAAGIVSDPAMLDFCILAYSAFRLGQAEMQGQCSARYRERILMQANEVAATRQGASVG